jgi:hypothetical protein
MAIYNPSQKIRTWLVWYYNSAWISDGYLPRAGINEFIDTWGTSSQTLILADGSQARTAPEHYHTREELTLTIPAELLTTAYKSKLKSYIASGAGLRIQTHEASDVYLEGYIVSLQDTWKLSGAEQKHVFEIAFQMFDVDGTGTI